MGKKRKRTQSGHPSKAATLVSSSTQPKKVKMIFYQQQKDKELNYLNRPHVLFK
jgi:hypothetical protein